jgi:hypothetical protein
MSIKFFEVSEKLLLQGWQPFRVNPFRMNPAYGNVIVIDFS